MTLDVVRDERPLEDREFLMALIVHSIIERTLQRDAKDIPTEVLDDLIKRLKREK